MTIIKNIWKLIGVLFVGILGGMIAFFTLSAFHPDFTNNQEGITKPTTVSKVTYKNTTNTTKAVKVVQNAVVSVINYRKSNPANQANDIFGEPKSSLNDDNGYSIYSEGSGVIYKKKVRMPIL